MGLMRQFTPIFKRICNCLLRELDRYKSGVKRKFLMDYFLIL
jgi:hypothetical protein